LDLLTVAAEMSISLYAGIKGGSVTAEALAATAARRRRGGRALAG
jgi:hypothetical protein